MIVKETSKVDKYGDSKSYKIYVENNKNDRASLFFCNGEPEDNTLDRNFNDVYAIVDLMKMAYEAGKNGEELEVDGEI